MRRSAFVAALVCAATALGASEAHATNPGENGRILLQRENGCFDKALYAIDPDGTDETRISPPGSNDWWGQWSPDGQRIAFTSPSPGGNCLNPEIWMMNADGTGRTRLTFNSPSTQPVWSPGGSKMAFLRPDPPGPCGERVNNIWTMNADGSGQTQVTGGGGDVYDLEWSPDGEWIAFAAAYMFWDPDNDCDNIFLGSSLARLHVPSGGEIGMDLVVDQLDWSPDSRKFFGALGGDLYTARAPEATLETQLTDTPSVLEASPTWSPDGTKLAYNRDGAVMVANSDGTGATQIAPLGGVSDWQPIHTYVRPKAATKVHAALVPAHAACTSPNRAHGGGMSYPSCDPPIHLSPTLTVGVGDGSPAFSRSVGSVVLRALTGNPAAPPDEADMSIKTSITNVMRKSDLSDYTGELGVDLSLKLTDKEGALAQTTMNFSLSATVPCTATASTIDGATCALNTTVEALVPAAITEGRRSIFALGPVKVRDGGSDEDADTPAGDGTLATQGVFVP